MTRMAFRCAVLGGAALALGTLTVPAAGQCVDINFGEFAPGEEITSDYDEVTFMAVPFTCSPDGPYPVIVVPGGGTSSGSQALSLQTGCPDFSDDYLRMVFDDLQRLVTFTVGEGTGTPGFNIQIRAYDTSNTLVGNQVVSTFTGTTRFVLVGSAGGVANIRRIEVETVNTGLFEVIDDLRFNYDATPPVVRIDSPQYGDCLCFVPDEDIMITGITCDDDGVYDRDRLESRPINAAPGTEWTLIREFVGSPVCTPGTLYGWDLTDVPHGRYLLRVTALNECGMAGTDTVSVFVDKQFGTVAVASPAKDEAVCGVVEIKGTVNDHCGSCFDYYTVEYSDSPNGPFAPVDPSQPTYTSWVVNGDLATWDTPALGLHVGNFTIRVTGYDDCDNTLVRDVNVTLDNSLPCPCSADVNGDGLVDTDDFLAVLVGWGVCP